MATLTLVYDTGAVPLSRITDAFASRYRYMDTIDGEANPETKAQFARRMVKEHIITVVRQEEQKVAIQAANAGVTTVSLT